MTGIEDKLIAARQTMEAGDDEAASALLGQIVTQAPRSADAYWQIGQLLGRNNRHTEAAAAFRRAVQLDPGLCHVEFSFAGSTICLADSPGSAAAAMLVEEAGKDMYGLQNMTLLPGAIVIDVGAHIGGVCILLAKLFPAIKILAFEPAPRNFAMLVRNIASNGVKNIVPIQAAIAGKTGAMELMWSPLDTASSGGCMGPQMKAHFAQNGWAKETVECVTLDDVFDQHHIDRCAWLKLDCEGAEYEIFSQSHVLERVDKISLELHIPESKLAMGEQKCLDEFLGLLNRLANPPPVAVVSAVGLRGA